MHALDRGVQVVLMSLIMTFMFEPAKLQMNWARASGTSTLRSDPVMAGRPAARS